MAKKQHPKTLNICAFYFSRGHSRQSLHDWFQDSTSKQCSVSASLYESKLNQTWYHSTPYWTVIWLAFSECFFSIVFPRCQEWWCSRALFGAWGWQLPREPAVHHPTALKSVNWINEMKFLKNLQERTYQVLVFSRDFMDVDVVMVAVVVQNYSQTIPPFMAQVDWSTAWTLNTLRFHLITLTLETASTFWSEASEVTKSPLFAAILFWSVGPTTQCHERSTWTTPIYYIIWRTSCHGAVVRERWMSGSQWVDVEAPTWHESLFFFKLLNNLWSPGKTCDFSTISGPFVEGVLVVCSVEDLSHLGIFGDL